MEKVTCSTGQELYFECRPAFHNPETSPILIQFHGWSGGIVEPGSTDYLLSFPDWTLVRPFDNFGFARNGCWWLGENRQFFFLELMDSLVDTLRNTHGLKGDLYAWGSSMGGFGALFHGFRQKFKAICANVPQARILGTDYVNNQAERPLIPTIFDPGVLRMTWEEVQRKIRTGEDPDLRYADATCFMDMETPENNPLVFLSQTRYDTTPGYFTQQCMYLVDRLIEAGCNFEMTVQPRQGHAILRDYAMAIQLFETHQDVIQNPFSCPPMGRENASKLLSV